LDNIITKNETDYSHPSGIFLYHTFYTTISGNIISNFDDEGINLEFSGSNSITMNTISNNNFGIRSFYSDTNYISNNIIDGNCNGILLDVTSVTIICINNFTNNQKGICITESQSSIFNKIYHNNFINNDENAEDLSSWLPTENYWDNGYPSGGNYWDDYTGEDNNGDGIGDEPYYLDKWGWGEDPKDNYPLVLPYNSNTYSSKIICDNLEITVYPYESAIYEIKVENTGNLIDSYVFGLFGEQICINVSLSDTELTLNPGENAIVFLTVTPVCEKKANYLVTVYAESIYDPNGFFDFFMTNTTVIMPPIVPDLKIVILQLGFGKVKAKIRNEGEENITDYINWTISVRSDGIFNKINFSANGTIKTLEKNCLVTIKTPRESVKHGLGRISAIVTISIQRLGGDTEEKSVLAIGFVIGRLIYFKFQRPIPPIPE
jgi:parallel beta-helix repeat protein